MTRLVPVRYTEADYAQIERLARLDGVPVSVWIRTAVTQRVSNRLAADTRVPRVYEETR